MSDVRRAIGVISLCLPVMALGPVREARCGTLSPSLQISSEEQQPQGTKVWIYLTDHGESNGTELQEMLSRVHINERALQRRATRSRSVQADEHDLPVNSDYVRAIEAHGAIVRHESRYLNAVSASVPREQLHALAELPFVRHVERVRTGTRKLPELERRVLTAVEKASPAVNTIEYGYSDAQHQMINTKPLHAAGYTGEGVRIAVLDTGFFLGHNALANTRVVAEWDFINNDPITADEPEDDEGQMWHGTHSLGIIASNWPGTTMGSAWDAEFILAKTERLLQELRIEEDDFVAALEWADGLGVDVVSSSLGYYFWYNYEDMDGNTAVTTVAADIAVSRGIVVVTSAGNEGGFPWPTLNAPADGDSVITVGSVEQSGTIMASSSRGPTFDGRIKPDVVALGRLVVTLNWQNPNGIAAAAGTSAAAPLVAGAAALLLQKHPRWSPVQVRDALRETASQSANPNNDYGWGIIDANAAASVVREIRVAVDVRPGSCDSPFNPKARGVLPVLVLGSEEVDVHEIDTGSLRLAGSSPLRAHVVDMSGVGECESPSPDGYDDVLLQFDADAIAISAGAMDGDRVALTLAGNLLDGTPIVGEGIVRIVGNQSARTLNSDVDAEVTPELGPAVPNPFNPTTRISYTIATRTHVQMSVYDIKGRLVATLVDGVRPAGRHDVEWNATGYASGVYFYRLRAVGIDDTRRLVLLK